MTTNAQSLPLKADVLGRVRITAKHREALLDAYEESSMSGAKLAAAHGVKYPTFASWIQKRRRDRGEYEPSNESVPAALLESLVELGLPLMQRCPIKRSSSGVSMIEFSDGLTPVSLQIQMILQPADEPDGALS